MARGRGRDRTRARMRGAGGARRSRVTQSCTCTCRGRMHWTCIVTSAFLLSCATCDVRLAEPGPTTIDGDGRDRLPRTRGRSREVRARTQYSPVASRQSLVLNLLRPSSRARALGAGTRAGRTAAPIAREDENRGRRAARAGRTFAERSTSAPLPLHIVRPRPSRPR